MLVRVEVHPGLLLVGVHLGDSHHSAAPGSRGGLDEYHGAPLHRRPVAMRENLKGFVWAARGALGRYIL